MAAKLQSIFLPFYPSCFHKKEKEHKIKRIFPQAVQLPAYNDLTL